MANFAETEETFRLIREADPDVIFCLSTNGLYLERHAQRLAELGVSHVTVTINTVDPKIGRRIYMRAVHDGRRHTGLAAAQLILERQLAGLDKLRELGLTAKVNTVLIKGVNDGDAENVAAVAKARGASLHNLMTLIPAPGSAFAKMEPASKEEMEEAREKCGAHLAQMRHCQQCRADAIGTLGHDCSARFRKIK